MKRIKYILQLAFLIIPVFSFAQKIYWLNADDGKIYYSNIDGSDINFINGVYSGTGPMSVDFLNSKIYLAESNQVIKMNLDGSAINAISSLSVYEPNDLLLNQENEKLYLSENQFPAVFVSSSNGSSINELTKNNTGILSSTIAIDIDNIAGKIYFSDTTDAKIYKMDLDGTNLSRIISLHKAIDLVASEKKEKLFWADSQDQRIWSSDLDGNNASPLNDSVFMNLSSVAFDDDYNKLYVSDVNETVETIYTMDWDGTDVEVFLTGHKAKTLVIEKEPLDISIDHIYGSPFHLSASSEAKLVISYNVTGVYKQGNKFIAELSDASGSFGSPVEIGSIESVDGGSLIVILPDDSPSGSEYRIRIRSTQPAYIGDESNSFEIVENMPPYFISEPIDTVSQNNYYQYFIKADDQNHDPVMYSTPELPSWLSFSEKDTMFVETLAGTNFAGFVDGSVESARFSQPSGIATDIEGNIFVSDQNNHAIRKISPDGTVETLAGGSKGDNDGTGSNAQFNTPHGITLDIEGNIYVADKGNHKIRKISPDGVVETFAGTGKDGDRDGPGNVAQFTSPRDVTIDRLGNLYVADSYNHKIKKITSDAIVSTIAGTGASGDSDGDNLQAEFNKPSGIVVDGDNNIFVADYGNHLIRKITLDGTTTTWAGNGNTGYLEGTGTQASFSYPSDLAIDPDGNIVLTDYNNHRIRKINTSKKVETLAGLSEEGFEDGNKETAQFNFPFALTIDGNNNIYIADRFNHSIRKINQKIRKISGTPSNENVGENQISIAISDGIATTTQDISLAVNAIPPTNSSTNIRFNNVQTTSLSLFWDKGNGGSRIVIASVGEPVSFVPQDGQDLSGVDNDFNIAEDKGNGNKILYNGEGNSLDVKGLPGGGNVYFTIYEYNGHGKYSRFLTENPATGVQATNHISTGEIEGAPFFITGTGPVEVKVPFSTQGIFNSNNYFYAYLSDKYGDFTNETLIGKKQAVSGDTITCSIPVGTPVGTGYKIRVNSDRPVVTGNPGSPFEIKSTVEVSVSSDIVRTNNSPVSVTIEFSDKVEGFEMEDINVVNCYTYNLRMTELSKQWEVDIYPTIENGYVTVTIPENAAKNLSGKWNLPSNQFSFYYDKILPEVELSTSVSSPTNDEIIPMTIEFSEDVETFSTDVIETTNCSIEDLFIYQPSKIWKANIIPADSLIEVKFPANKINDLSGNPNQESNIIKLTYDTLNPYPTIIPEYTSYSNKLDIPLTIKFNKKIFGFDKNDIKVIANGSVESLTKIDSVTYSAVIKAQEGLMEMIVLQNTVLDEAGNTNNKSAEYSIVCDVTKPRPELLSINDSPTNDSTVIIDILMSESVLEFTDEDIFVENATISKFDEITPSRQWFVHINPLDTGMFSIWIPEVTFIDSAKNVNLESNKITMQYDTIRPQTEIFAVEEDTTNEEEVQLKLEFSEKVNLFTQTDIQVINGTLSSFIEDSAGVSYSITVNPKYIGIIYVNLPENTVVDSAGNFNLRKEFSFVFDDINPNPVFQTKIPDSTNQSEIPVELIFDEKVFDFNLADITVQNASISNFTEAETGKKFTFNLKPRSEGEVTLFIDKEVCRDKAGNLNNASVQIKTIYDITRPGVNIEYAGTGSNTNNFGLFVTFTEKVKQFQLTNISITNIQEKTNLIKQSDSLFYLEFIPYANDTLVIRIPANSVTDPAGNGNLASGTLSIPFGRDTKAPVVEIIVPGDTIDSDAPIAFKSNEEISTLDPEKIIIENGSLHDLKKTDDKTYSASLIPLNQGFITITLEKGAFKDLAYFDNVYVQKEIEYIPRDEPFELTRTTFDENIEAGTAIAMFQMNYPYTTDGDYTFKLVPSNGITDADNDKFTVRGDSLVTLEKFNFEKQGVYLINAQARGPSFTPKNYFTLKIKDVSEAPYLTDTFPDVKYRIGEPLQENLPVFYFVDEDAGDNLDYLRTLANGDDLPDWLNIDDNLILWAYPEYVPNKDDTLAIKISAIDDSGNYVSEIFNLIIIADHSGIDKSNSLKVKIYPNPSLGFISIEPGYFSPFDIKIFDLAGRTLIHKNYVGKKVEMNLSGLSQGTYLLKYISEKGTCSRSVIIR